LLAVFEDAIWVKSMYMTKSRFKFGKKRENWKAKMLRKYLSKRLFTNKIHSLLKRADARDSYAIVYRICYADR